MAIELLIGAIKAIIVLLMVLQLSAILLWFERKGSALIQDRVGANRAAITGLGRRLGLPNLGFVNTLMADPLKLFTKEDFVPAGADKFIHALAPFLAMFPVLITFAVIPFGDTLIIGNQHINLQAANLNVAALYILATIGLGVYGVSLGGWASNNRWALLGGIRATAQMISYELAMGLAIVSMVMTYGTLDLQAMCHAQGGVWFGWLPRWGIFVQPVAFLLLLTAGMAESKRVPFDLPEGESELIAGYFTEYSGGKQAVFMLVDFAEIVLVSALVTTFFFGGWQFPWLYPDGFHLPGGAFFALPNIVVAIIGVISFTVKVVAFCWLQILARWTLPRFRYDQLMRLGWKGLLPVGLANVVVTACVIVFGGVWMPLWLFMFLAALSVISAAGVILQRHPVHSLLALVLTLVVVALLFMGLGATTVGFLQIIVYAGAIMILFLFVIWLLNLQSQPLEGGRLALKFLGALGSAVLIAELLVFVLHLPAPLGYSKAVPMDYGSIGRLAQGLFSDYLVAFEVTSILLLVGVVGGVALARRTTAQGGAPGGSR